MAAGAAGAALTTSGNGTWQASQLPGGNDIVALALAPAPQWNAGVADLFAVSSGGVLASDDEGATFTSLPSPPAGGLLSATVMAGPRPLLLLGRPAASLERFDLTDLSWTKGVGAVAGDIISCAAGPGSIAYALSADGHVACTMSYGDAPASLGTTPTTVTAGDDVNITLSSPIRAPGTLVLESRAVGGRWEELASWPWSTAPSALGDVVDEPLATTRYRVRFVYAGATGATSAGTDVSVRPDIVLLRTSFTLNRGDLYRLAGQVLPAHPGGHVTVWTNRGGPWHRITLGGTLGLVGGSSFRTRLFGTPIRETYRLQIRMTADAGHLAGASAVVKVTIR
jgi:hypothetical protein